MNHRSTLVSALMVTANRRDLARRAIACLANQLHPNRELVVVDDGTDDYGPLLRTAEAFMPVRHVRLSPDSRLSLGELRNIAIESARGDWCIQWDDDEWCHPDRISRQLGAALASDSGASALKWTLMRIPTGGGNLNFRTSTGIATPGTLLFRRGEVRYPALARNEDGIFMREIQRAQGLTVLGHDASHLFVRVFHGDNTWDHGHFKRRLWRTPRDATSYFVAVGIHGDVTRHRAFRLTADEQLTITDFDDYCARHPGPRLERVPIA